MMEIRLWRDDLSDTL